MFTSSKNTLVFAALVIVGALMLVGGEDSPDTVAGANDNVKVEREVGELQDDNEEQWTQDENEDPEYDEFYDSEDLEYAEDDDLIDEATGFDPSEDIQAFQPEPDLE